MTARAAVGDGVLLVDKPPGPTSHDVVREARRALATRRIGHTGTLDPFASGLLILCVGRATRLAEYLHELPKRYEAVARLGRVTDTLDPEGEVIDENPAWRELDEARVRAALQGLEGAGEQEPPVFSAKKVGGQAAHRRARRGEAVQLPAVPVVIHALEPVELALPRLRFRAEVSTGTYVRAIARDLGRALGVGAHLEELRRISIGDFRVEDALTPERLDDRAAVDAAWISPGRVLHHLPAVELGHDGARRIEAGAAVPLEGSIAPAEAVAVFEGERLVAVGRIHEGVLRPRKVFPRE